MNEHEVQEAPGAPRGSAEATDDQRGEQRREARGGAGERQVRGRPFQPGNPYRWRKGQSGNPSGLQHQASVTAELKRLLNETDGDDGLTGAERIALALLRLVEERGSVEAAKVLLDRTEGRVAEKVKIEHQRPKRVILDTGQGDAPRALEAGEPSGDQGEE